jgi:hypothetical protein
MCTFNDECNFFIEYPYNEVLIDVYSIQYVQSALSTTSVNVIIILHELALIDLYQLLLMVFSNVFNIVIFRLVYNATWYGHPVVHSCYLS